MSKEAFGYVYPLPDKDKYEALMSYVGHLGVGFSRMEKNELYNVPESFMEEKDILPFIIGDRPGYHNTTYLMDCYYHYDPISSTIKFPADPRCRLKLFLDIIVNVFTLLDCQKMIIILTDGGQVESIKKIKVSEVIKIIGEDFMRYQGPPDILYEIKK